MRSRITLLLIALLLLAACSPGEEAASQTDIVKTDSFSVALGDRSEGQVQLSARMEEVSITALTESDNLIEADVEHVGEVTLADEDGVIALEEAIPSVPYEGEEMLRWAVGLNPAIPLELRLYSESGTATLDATALDLSFLRLRVDSGRITADLPDAPLTMETQAGSGRITVNVPENGMLSATEIQVGAGQVDLNIAEGSSVTLKEIVIGSGGVMVDAPTGAAVRIEISNVASGSVNFAFPVVRITGTASDEGMWETEGFANAETQISIIVTEIGSGRFELE